jgi:chloride channel protein, CIC family
MRVEAAAAARAERPRPPPHTASSGDAATGHARFSVALILVAVGAAAFAVGFRLSLLPLYRYVSGEGNVVAFVSALPFWLRLTVPVAGALFAGLVSRCCISRAQGVSNVMEAVALGNVRLSLKTTGWRVAGSWAAIGSGMSIGREGPLIEFGGSLGAALGRLVRLSVHRTRVLVAAGTAAGFAAAYNTPFAAVLFVLETLVGIAALEALLPIMTATLVATTLTRAIVGGGPIYGQRAFVLGSPLDLVPYGLLGIVAALAAIGFKRLLAIGELIVERRPVSQPFRAAIGGLLVGSIAVFLPLVAGNGYEALNQILDGRLGIATVAVLLIAKVFATSGSVASGVPGGVFTPVLLVGGAVGALAAHGVAALGGPFVASAGSYALVGMAAVTDGYCEVRTKHPAGGGSDNLRRRGGDDAGVRADGSSGLHRHTSRLRRDADDPALLLQ